MRDARDPSVERHRALPPAPPREVAAWVERIAGDVVAARRAAIVAMESGVDGVVVATSLDGRALHADPGAHEIRVTPAPPRIHELVGMRAGGGEPSDAR